MIIALHRATERTDPGTGDRCCTWKCTAQLEGRDIEFEATAIYPVGRDGFEPLFDLAIESGTDLRDLDLGQFMERVKTELLA